MEIEWVLAAEVTLVFVLAGTLQGLTGFGLGMSSMALLPLFMADMTVAVPVSSIAKFAAVPPMLIELRKHINWTSVFRFSVGILVGTLVGAHALARLDQRITLAALASLVICVSLRGLWRVNHAPPTHHTAKPPSWLTASVLGVGAGFLSAYVNAPGAIPSLYAYVTLPALGTRALLTGLFALMSAAQVGAYAYEHLWTARVLVYGAVSIPATILGVRLGSKLHYRLGHRGTVRVAWSVLLVLGVVHGMRALGVVPMPASRSHTPRPAATRPSEPDAARPVPNGVDLGRRTARLGVVFPPR